MRTLFSGVKTVDEVLRASEEKDMEVRNLAGVRKEREMRSAEQDPWRRCKGGKRRWQFLRRRRIEAPWHVLAKRDESCNVIIE